MCPNLMFSVFWRAGLQPLELQGLKPIMDRHCSSGLKPRPPKETARNEERITDGFASLDRLLDGWILHRQERRLHWCARDWLTFDLWLRWA